MLPRRWLAAFATTFVAAFAVGVGMPGCQTRCYTAFDCGPGAFCNAGRCETQCYVDDDCIHPPDCQDNPLACAPRGLRCNAVGRCIRGTIDPRPHAAQSVIDVGIPSVIEGWEDAPGTGHPFIVSSLSIADRDRGFDVDGRCKGPGDCIDNALYQLGQLGNDQIRQGLLGGETLLLIELAGVDTPFAGNDSSLTAKFYGARDADVPFRPDNNFGIPTGEVRCCEFKINPQSTAGVPPQARARAPARLIRGHLTSLVPVPVTFTLTIGQAPHPEIRMEKVLISAQVPANLSTLDDGLLGGAVPVNTLATIENPYCKTLNNLCQRTLKNSTLIDLIASILPPDVDLDVPLDGLERLEGGADGRIEHCFQADGTRIEPADPANAHTCARNPELADGYSVAINFSGVHASVVGVGQ